MNFKLQAKTVSISVHGPSSVLPRKLKRKVSPDCTWEEFLTGKCNVVLTSLNKSDLRVKVNRHDPKASLACLSERIRDFIEKNYKRAMSRQQYCVRIMSMAHQRTRRSSRPTAPADHNTTTAAPPPVIIIQENETTNDVLPESDVLQNTTQPIQGCSKFLFPELKKVPPMVTSLTTKPTTQSQDNEIPDEDRKFRDTNTVIEDLKRRKIKYDNIMPNAERRLKEFGNAGLLKARREYRELRNLPEGAWAKVSQQAPQCYLFLDLLFRD